jgi:dTDP-glucose 4,6-dehydratase
MSWTLSNDYVHSHPLAQDLRHIAAHTGALWNDLRGGNVFVTGGTGFPGTWMIESLLAADVGASVTILTRNPDAYLQREPRMAGHPSMRLLQGDVRSFEMPEGQYPFVIHMATEDFFAPTHEEPLGTFARDVDGTRRVLEFARTHGARRLLFTSSGAVYGKQPSDLERLSEEYAGAPDTHDLSTYGIGGQAKRVSELLCAMYAQQYGFAATIARMFTFFGPRLPLDGKFAAGNFIRDALNGGPVRVAGDGTPLRSYLYAADLAIWLWTILLRGQSARPYNTGSPHPISIGDLARSVAAAVPGAQVEIAKPPSGAPPERYIPCTARAQRELGLTAWIDLEEGIRRTLAWNRQRNETLGLHSRQTR